MAAYGLKNVRDSILYANAEDFIDDIKFVLLYDSSYSWEVCLYWKFHSFDLDNFDMVQCPTEFPHNKKWHLLIGGCVTNTYENYGFSKNSQLQYRGYLYTFKKISLSLPIYRYGSKFGRNPTEIHLIFNYVQDFIYSQHSHRMSTWNQTILSPGQLLTYANTVHGKWAPLTNSFGFIDGTVITISRSNSNQRILFNGHKRTHGIKFQSLALHNWACRKF